MTATELIAAQIRREGSITFDAFMEVALYDSEHGFFASGHGAGRAGRDFVTAPEVGALYGACVARQIDRTWRSLGSPDPFLVVDVGAGNGRLAREVQRAAPDSLSALRYVLVERSAVLRAQQRELLPIEPADEALGPFAMRTSDEEVAPVHAAGPVFASLPDLPEMPVDSFVFANELLDNLPFGIAEWDGDRWNEVRVALAGPAFVELLVPAADSDIAMLTAIESGHERAIPVGARVPIPRGIEAWLAECSRSLHTGVVVLVDYVVDFSELFARGRGWLRTYREQTRSGDPLDAPGAQDITGDVVREQLAHAATASGFAIAGDQSQTDWLEELGVDELVAAGRQAWEDGAARGDLAALAGRSRVHEGAALTDPTGLGAHRVVTFVKRRA